jgi:hypothetical protein
MACAPTPPSCNPVTNAGCAAGDACDFTQDQNMQTTFKCYPPPPPNTVMVCGACDDMNTACQGGATCLIPSGAMMGKCGKYCCADGDCGTGVCNKGSTPFGVGICLTAASVDAGMADPSCDAPAVSPSMGTCVMGLDGGAPADAGSG